MDEVKKEEQVATTNTATNTTATNTLPTNEERIQQINNMYQANLDSQKANLEAAYQQNLSNAQANRDAIDTTYGEQKNQLAAEYERQRRNNNIQAMNNGLNTGAGSQMALAQEANYQSNAAKLSKAQAQATTEADRNLADITTNYQLQVNEAVAKNDYQKAAALLDEYNNQKSDMNTQAQTLAAYGDFSGYASMYGQETANSMQKAWSFQNPDMAYNLSKVTGDEYYQITGKYPAGYVPGSNLYIGQTPVGGVNTSAGGEVVNGTFAQHYGYGTGSPTDSGVRGVIALDPNTGSIITGQVDNSGNVIAGTAKTVYDASLNPASNSFIGNGNRESDISYGKYSGY